MSEFQWLELLTNAICDIASVFLKVFWPSRKDNGSNQKKRKLKKKRLHGPHKGK